MLTKMIAAERIKYLQNRLACFEDQQAYKELFSEFYSYLYSFATSLVKSKQLAEEIVSDVFIKIWEKRLEIENILNLKIYLYIATRNIAFNYLEKQKRTATNSLDEFSLSIKSLYIDPEQLLITADMILLIQHAIDKLPPKCKIIFKFVKEDGLKYKEVAELLSISVKTVENQLGIALQKIGAVISFDIRKSISTPMGQSN